MTAIRGFVYQYYVAAKYLIDMLFSKTAWWDKVIFELLDDIALCGDKKIRFIQVKTKRESNLSNTLTLSELNNRDKKKGVG
ncbi:dsDNA nuclease domain-containing protein [Bacillus cereus]